jgi:hypothetical protein
MLLSLSSQRTIFVRVFLLSSEAGGKKKELATDPHGPMGHIYPETSSLWPLCPLREIGFSAKRVAK